MAHVRALSGHDGGLLVSALAACAAANPVEPSAPAASTALREHAVDERGGGAGARGRRGGRVGGMGDKPPKNILDVMHAPSPPQAFVNPTHDAMLLVSWQDYPPMSRVAAPFLRLAGVRVEPKNHSRHDTPGGYGITPCATDYVLVRVAGGPEVRVSLPPAGCAGRPGWTVDGKRFAFQNIATDSVELWLGDASGEVHRVPGVRLNPMLGGTVQWMPDQKTLLVKLVPKDLGEPPPAPVVPASPSIQETNGQKGESSTYETRDTLKDKHDEDLFDHYGASQLALVDAATDNVTPMGKVGLHDMVDAAPDGVHILVSTLKKPYSYVTTFNRFPQQVDVWDRSGAVVHQVASLPLADRVPVHGVPTGPRDFSWRATEPATLVWAEALDGGDWKAKVPARDKVLMHKAPFTSPAVEVTRTEQRFEGFYWGEQPAMALLREEDENRHWARTFQLDVDEAHPKPRLVWDHSTDEHYKHPGWPVFRALPNGAWVVKQDGEAIYLSGAGASREGDRPFLDRFDLKTQKTERLFRSDRKSLESFIAFTGPDTRTFITWHQSPSDPPNAFLRTVGAKAAGAAAGEPEYASTATAITHLPDPSPEVRAIKKRLVKYKRKDGVDLSFTSYSRPIIKGGNARPGGALCLSTGLRRRVEGGAGQRFGADVHPAPELQAPALGWIRHHRQRRVSDRRRSQEGL